jgi:hypothetical protein
MIRHIARMVTFGPQIVTGWWSGLQHKFRWFLVAIATYISITGLVTFSLFIHEEAIQTTMFGTWPAQDAGRWDVVKEGVGIMEGINRSMRIINYVGGWIQPLAFISYGNYAKATDYYTKALKAKTMAHAPQLFIGENVDIELPVNEARIIDGGLEARNGAIIIRFRPDQRAPVIRVQGKLEMVGNVPMVDIR